MLKTMGLCRLTRDPVLKAVGETHVCNFGVAVNERFTKKDGEKVEKVHYFDCELWDKGAEIFVKYVNKGDQVVIEARPKYDAWEDAEGNKRNKVYFRVDQFYLVSPNRNSETPTGDSTDTTDKAADDEAPF